MKQKIITFLTLCLILSACSSLATPTATQVPSQTALPPTATMTETPEPTATDTPTGTFTPMVDERFRPDTSLFIIEKNEMGVVTVKTNRPILEVVDASTKDTHLFVDHIAQKKALECVGPTIKSVVISNCYIHVLPQGVTGFKASEGDVRDFAGLEIFYNRATVNDPWAVYFKDLPPTETVTPIPSATVYSTITAAPAPITTVADALKAMDDSNLLPDTRFCSNAQDEVGVVTAQDGTVYFFSDTGCIEVHVSDASKPFQRIAPIGKVNAPVRLKNAPWMDHPWVFVVTPVKGSYGFRWHKNGIVGLGLHMVNSTNNDGYKSYWIVTLPTSTPTVTRTPTPTRTPNFTPTPSITPSNTLTPTP